MPATLMPRGVRRVHDKLRRQRRDALERLAAKRFPAVETASS